MDNRKELINQYKEMKIEGGVYKIENTINGKVYVEATPNFKTINGRQMMLEGNSHVCAELQKDYNEYGSQAFVFEPLETLEVKEDVYFDTKHELEKLKDKWIMKLESYDSKGYNKKPRE